MRRQRRERLHALQLSLAVKKERVVGDIRQTGQTHAIVCNHDVLIVMDLEQGPATFVIVWRVYYHLVRVGAPSA